MTLFDCKVLISRKNTVGNARLAYKNGKPWKPDPRINKLKKPSHNKITRHGNFFSFVANVANAIVLIQKILNLSKFH